MNVLYGIIFWCLSNFALLCLLFIRHAASGRLRYGDREPVPRETFRAPRKNIA